MKKLIGVVRNNKIYVVIDETETEVCVIDIVNYYPNTDEILSMWWEKKNVDTLIFDDILLPLHKISPTKRFYSKKES